MKSLNRLMQVGVLAVAAVAVMGAWTPASAQVNDVSFGYQFLHFNGNGGDGTNVPAGFFGDVTGSLGPSLPMLDWIGQITYGRKSDSSSVLGVSVDSTENLTTFGGGVRYKFSSMDSGKFVPHAQALLLVAHDSFSTSTSIGNNSGSGSDSETNPGLEISAGVDVPLNNGWSFTGAVGFWRIFASSGENVFVARAGVTKVLKK